MAVPPVREAPEEAQALSLAPVWVVALSTLEDEPVPLVLMAETR